MNESFYKRGIKNEQMKNKGTIFLHSGVFFPPQNNHDELGKDHTKKKTVLVLWIIFVWILRGLSAQF